MGTKPAISLDQFEEILRTHEDSNFEFEDGELIPLSSPTFAHQELKGLLYAELLEFVRRLSLGRTACEVDFRLSPDSVRRPDISVLFNATIAKMDLSVIPIAGAPDIAIEIVSPNDSAAEINHKTHLYLRSGCREVWVVHMRDRQVQIWKEGGCRSFGGNSTLESPELPGFSLPLTELFSVLDTVQ